MKLSWRCLMIWSYWVWLLKNISVFRAAAQRQVFHDRPIILRCFQNFFLSVLDLCSAVWCSAADSHLKLLDKVVRSSRLSAGSDLECNLAHHRSVAVLCMLFKIKNNLMHILWAVQCLCRMCRLMLLVYFGYSSALVYASTFQNFSAKQELNLCPCLYRWLGGVGWASMNSRANKCFIVALICSFSFLPLFSPFFHPWGGYVALYNYVGDWWSVLTLSQLCTADYFYW